MWRGSHGFHSSLCLYLGSVTLALLIHLGATEGSSSVAAEYEADCTVYHLQDGNPQSSSTPPIPIAESLTVYLYSESPNWSGFSLGFTDWHEKTTGMLTYQEDAEDAGGFFTLTGIEEHGTGDDSARKYMDEVVKIPQDVYSIQHNVWNNLTLVVQDNMLKVLFTDAAIVHFTFDAATYNKAFVHIDQSHAISVTFNCIEGTGANHSSSEIGLVVGITLLIITVLSVAAFYILKKRIRQPTKNLEKGQGEDIENSKGSTQNDPTENEILLQKDEDKKEDIYSTENEAKSDETMPDRMSEVTAGYEAIIKRKFCTEKNHETSNRTGKHTRENIKLAKMTLAETKTSQESGGIQFCKSGELHLVYVSSIHDETKIKDFHKESAQHILEVDPNEGNIITDTQSKENLKQSILNLPHTMLQCSDNSTKASGMDAHGTQNQNDSISVLLDNINSKSSTEILYNKDGEHKDAIVKVPVFNRPPVSEDVFDRAEIKRVSGEKNPTKNNTKKTTRNSRKTKPLSPKNHPPELTNVQCKNTVQDISTSVIEQSENCSQIASLISKDSSKSHKSRETASQLAVGDSVTQLGLPKIKVSQITPDSKLGVSDQEDNLGLFGQAGNLEVSRQKGNLGVSGQEGNLGLFGQERTPGLADQEGNLGLSKQSQPSRTQNQTDNIQVLLSNRTQKQDIHHIKIQQGREKVQPSAEDEIRSIKSKEAMNCETGRSSSSRKNNENQDHRGTKYQNNATFKQSAYGRKRKTRDLGFPTNYIGADMVLHDHPQAENLDAACKEPESGWIGKTSTNLSEDDMFCLKRISTFFRHKSSNWRSKPFHRNLRKHFTRNKLYRNNRDALHVCHLVHMRDTCLKKSGYRGRGISEVVKFNLNIRSFRNISPSWINKGFHISLHKKFTRKLPCRKKVDLLHILTRLNMGKRENSIRYLLENIRHLLQNKTLFLIKNTTRFQLQSIIHCLSLLNKSDSQIYQNSLRKTSFQSRSNRSIEMKEISVENNSAMETSQITINMEFGETSGKGLPSSDEEML